MDKFPGVCLIRAREQAVRAEILNKDSAQFGHSRSEKLVLHIDTMWEALT